VAGAGLVAREVEQVDGARAAHQVRRGEHRGEHQEGDGERRVGRERGGGGDVGCGVVGEAVGGVGDGWGEEEVQRVGDGEVVALLQGARPVPRVLDRAVAAAAAGGGGGGSRGFWLMGGAHGVLVVRVAGEGGRRLIGRVGGKERASLEGVVERAAPFI